MCAEEGEPLESCFWGEASLPSRYLRLRPFVYCCHKGRDESGTASIPTHVHTQSDSPVASAASQKEERR